VCGAASRKKKSKEKGDKETPSQPSQSDEVQNEESTPARPHIQVMSGAALTEEHDEESDATAAVAKVKTVNIACLGIHFAGELTVAK
jgi:hypothetical protein